MIHGNTNIKLRKTNLKPLQTRAVLPPADHDGNSERTHYFLSFILFLQLLNPFFFGSIHRIIEYCFKRKEKYKMGFIFSIIAYFSCRPASWSGFLTTNHEVPGSILGSTMGIFPGRGRFPW